MAEMYLITKFTYRVQHPAVLYFEDHDRVVLYLYVSASVQWKFEIVQKIKTCEGEIKMIGYNVKSLMKTNAKIKG